MLNCALIGFGGIANAHRKAFCELEEKGLAKLVCAYDIDPGAFDRNVTINISSGDEPLSENIKFYTDLELMLANESIDFVDVCVPSYLHKEMTVNMLARGYHVMCEKPMSLCYSDCLEMIDASRKAGRELMIGQCLRFYEGFERIKEMIDDGRYGKVICAQFSRLSTSPTWGYQNWFMKPELSGGCITDMHIHDVDIIRYLFGEPEAVSCRASSSVCIYDSVQSSFVYGTTPVLAIADWTLVGMPFTAESRISFEKATVSFTGSELVVYPKDGGDSFVAFKGAPNAQFGELKYFVEVIEGKRKNTKNTPESAAESLRLVEVLKSSVEQNGMFIKP